MSNAKSSMIVMNSKNAIKLDIDRLDKSEIYLEEKTLSKD